MKVDYTNVSGWIAVDKPKGITSFDVIRQIKRLGKFSKIGHTGTLDPFATGVLVVALGSSTRLIEYAMNSRKGYEFTIQFGQARDSLDVDGNIVGESDERPTKDQVVHVINAFIGELEQVPPHFSAVKVDGKRAYEIARAGVEFELKAKKVTLYKCEMLAWDSDSATFQIECSKGFYVRSFARDICDKLGVLGYVSELRRTLNAKFTEKDIISLPELEKMVHNDPTDFVKSVVHPLPFVLDDILVHRVDGDLASRLSMGQRIKAELQDSEAVAVYHENELIAICAVESGCLKPKKVFV